MLFFGILSACLIACSFFAMRSNDVFTHFVTYAGMMLVSFIIVLVTSAVLKDNILTPTSTEYEIYSIEKGGEYIERSFFGNVEDVKSYWIVHYYNNNNPEIKRGVFYPSEEHEISINVSRNVMERGITITTYSYNKEWFILPKKATRKDVSITLNDAV